MQLKASARQPLGKRSRRMLREGKLPAFGHPRVVRGRHHAPRRDRDGAPSRGPHGAEGREPLGGRRRVGRQNRAQARAQGRRGNPGRGGRGPGRGRSCRGRRGSGRSRNRDRGMTLASIGGWSVPVPDFVYYPVVVVVAVAATYVVARIVARFVGEKVREQHMRAEMVVVTRRVVTAGVIVLGVFLALGWAAQNANVTLFGLLLATVVAALGVQQLLQDYVSGYYVLLERHIRIGDRITFD